MILGSDVRHLSPPPHVLPHPQKEALPNEFTQRQMLPMQSPATISKIPRQKHPRFPNGPLQRETPVSRAFFYTFPAKTPVNEPSPSMFSNRVPMEREASFLETTVYTFIHICQSPKQGALPRKMGKIFGHRPRSPTCTEGLHALGCGLVPQG